jgi:hypothetical protein
MLVAFSGFEGVPALTLHDAAIQSSAPNGNFCIHVRNNYKYCVITSKATMLMTNHTLFTMQQKPHNKSKKQIPYFFAK